LAGFKQPWKLAAALTMFRAELQDKLLDFILFSGACVLSRSSLRSLTPRDCRDYLVVASRNRGALSA
jgi:hypothetical protein